MCGYMSGTLSGLCRPNVVSISLLSTVALSKRLFLSMSRWRMLTRPDSSIPRTMTSSVKSSGDSTLIIKQGEIL